ncbi:TPA: coniferyl-alcohol dehydrogenase [Pseudomonas aeruginosa]
MLQDKRFLVTGVSSGIGEATAVQLRAAGAQVIGVDIRPPRVELEGFFSADLGSREAIDALVRKVPQGLDGLANIAGLPPTQPVVAVLRVNLVGLKYLTLKMLPQLADGAAIVNLASLAGVGWADALPTIRAADGLDFDGVAEFARRQEIDAQRSYFFSKEALLVWTLQNRWTWRERGIRMNAVSPGPVDTPILGDFLRTLGERAEEDMRTIGRPGRAEDIAPVVMFLLDDASRWLWGVNIPADGGMFAHLQATRYGV